MKSLLQPTSVAAALPLEQLEEGDVIFIRIGNFLYSRVAQTTKSWDSHVGILFRAGDGNWEVAESTVPLSRFTSLDAFLRRSEGGRYAVRRLAGGLSAEQKSALRAACERRMGILYHLGFNFDSPRLYCSKLVHAAYLEATGRQIGTVETFRELIVANPGAPLWFWRAWFFGFVPWSRRVVTTTSQLRSAALVTICEGRAADRPPSATPICRPKDG